MGSKTKKRQRGKQKEKSKLKEERKKGKEAKGTHAQNRINCLNKFLLLKGHEKPLIKYGLKTKL